MITFFLNGKPHDSAEGVTLGLLLQDLHLSPHNVIVEFNQEFLERERFDATKLREGDHVEIIRAMAGG